MLRKLLNNSKIFFFYKIFRLFYTYKPEKNLHNVIYLLLIVRLSSLIVIRLFLFAWKLELFVKRKV